MSYWKILKALLTMMHFTGNSKIGRVENCQKLVPPVYLELESTLLQSIAI